MRTFLYLFFMIYLAGIACGQSYYINEGYDFATGETLTEKRLNDHSNGKIVWLKRGEGCKKLYVQYHLSYPEPLPRFYCGTGYTFEWGKILTMNRGWKFWRWRYYILRDRPGACWDGAAPESTFFRILQECNPTEAEAKKIFAATVNLIRAQADWRKIEKYLTEQYELLKTDDYRRMFTDYLKSHNAAASRAWEDHSRGILRLVMREREKWPDRLPDHFYRGAFKPGYSNVDYYDFFLFEYNRTPSVFHAVLLAWKTQDTEKLFKELYDRNRLTLFLRQTMPEKLPPLPPPTPKGIPISIDSDNGKYWEFEYRNLPYREQLLQWRCHRGILKSYWNELLRPQLNGFSR